MGQLREASKIELDFFIDMLDHVILVGKALMEQTDFGLGITTSPKSLRSTHELNFKSFQSLKLDEDDLEFKVLIEVDINSTDRIILSS